MDWTAEDRIALRRAKSLLEHPGLAVRIADMVGAPIEKLVAALPEGANEMIRTATTKALNGALRVATRTLDAEPRPAADRLHTIAVAATGAAGGALGLATLAAELPVSTTIMLRSIADIARSQGHPVQSPRVQLACLEVFALGSKSRDDNAAETGYFAVRAALARALSEAAEHLLARGAAAESAPVLARLVSTIASRFGITVTDKVVAQSLPLLGAAGGAAINVLFIAHFQDVARGHFTILRLEERYGEAAVRSAYAAM